MMRPAGSAGSVSPTAVLKNWPEIGDQKTIVKVFALRDAVPFVQPLASIPLVPGQTLYSLPASCQNWMTTNPDS